MSFKNPVDATTLGASELLEHAPKLDAGVHVVMVTRATERRHPRHGETWRVNFSSADGERSIGKTFRIDKSAVHNEEEGVKVARDLTHLGRLVTLGDRDEKLFQEAVDLVGIVGIVEVGEFEDERGNVRSFVRRFVSPEEVGNNVAHQDSLEQIGDDFNVFSKAKEAPDFDASRWGKSRGVPASFEFPEVVRLDEGDYAFGEEGTETSSGNVPAV